jgi:hypothetical protein
MHKAEYPDLAEDFATLDTELVPVFIKYDTDALRDQNRYRRQKSTVLFGAALLAGLGGLQAVFPDQRWPTVTLFFFGIFLASSSRIVDESTKLDNYLRARVKAERLRSLYFSYLSRIGSFADEDRVQMLRKAVLAIQRGQEIE